MDRRTLLTTALFAFGAGRLPFPAFVETALAQDATAGKKWRHGLSLFGDSGGRSPMRLIGRYRLGA